MTDSAFPSREELLGGMPARRASTILFAIESLTSQLVERSRRALTRFQAGATAVERERQFIDAVAGARESTERPSVQDLERYAEAWSYLVPEVPDIRAALLHLLGQRYALDYARVPRLRAALSADAADVASSYERLQRSSIADVYAPSSGWRERLRWHRSMIAERLENLPPFWMAFSLTLTETVGAGLLALPIALAGVGVIPGLVLLAVFGLVSVMTLAALVEAITRDGSMRYGYAYYGKLVANHLGRPGALILAVALLALNALTLIVAMTGFGSVLGSATGVPPAIWVALLFAAVLFVLRREALDATVASALIIGGISLCLIAAIVVLGLVHVDVDRLLEANVPMVDGPLDGSVIALVFGVLLFVYFGHTSAGNAARVVLRRDPSGRTLLWGNTAATMTAAVVYGLFVIAVNGAVPSDRLATETGTALSPLAEVAGPAVSILGSAFATLALGIGALYMALGLYNQVSERLPAAGGRRGLSRNQRFLLAAAPAVAVFVVLQALLFVGAESFSGLLNLVGAITVPLVGGIFPMLILLAARRRGERLPGTVLQFLGYPVVAGAIVLLYLGGVAAHALVIWEDPLDRLIAASTALVMVGAIAAAVRRGSFRRRRVVEIRTDEPPGGGMEFSVVADGRPHAVEVTLRRQRGVETGPVSSGRVEEPDDLSSIEFALPAGGPSELVVWSHQPARDGDSLGLAVELTVARGSGTASAIRSDGRATVEIGPDGAVVSIRPLRSWAARSSAK